MYCCVVKWREGDELKFITRVELSPFTETSTVEMSGFIHFFFLLLPQTRVHQPQIIFPKVLITEITNTVKRCSWPWPGIFPARNHLLRA